MEFRYQKLDRKALMEQKLYDELKQLFQMLMIRLKGNAEKVKEVMQLLQERGYIDEKVQLQDFFDSLEANKLLRKVEGKYETTNLGKLKIGEEVFREIFPKLKRGGSGQHNLAEYGGAMGDLGIEKRKFVFGDDTKHLDYSSSFFNNIKRSASLELSLAEEDLEVFELERATDTALALMIDISHSMILYGEDRITPAKELALALAHIIRTYYPKDDLSVVLFGDDAVKIEPRDIVHIAVGPYHTNTQMGLRKAREILLKKRQLNKQIIMITDGKPSMIKLTDGTFYKNSFGLDPEIVSRTLDEAILCRKRSIPITTFMITDDPILVEFVKKLTKINMGKAFYCSPDNLGSFIIDNFLDNKRKRSY
ncbi:hypothetical protein COTS27_01316 [Spirochaetota bacterium]|nr:hypothetical protein COTS27_01316 [Spirochaetota bacterium]